MGPPSHSFAGDGQWHWELVLTTGRFWCDSDHLSPSAKTIDDMSNSIKTNKTNLGLAKQWFSPFAISITVFLISRSETGFVKCKHQILVMCWPSLGKHSSNDAKTGSWQFSFIILSLDFVRNFTSLSCSFHHSHWCIFIISDTKQETCFCCLFSGTRSSKQGKLFSLIHWL